MKEAYKGVQAAHLVVRDQLAICRFLGRKVQFADLRMNSKSDGKSNNNRESEVLDVDSDDLEDEDLGFNRNRNRF